MTNAIALHNKLEKELELARKRNRTRRNKNPDALQQTHRERFIERQKIHSALCSICRVRVEGKALHLDHCHKTGITRGYLCHSCNVGLGYFKDNIKLLHNAIKYLEWHNLMAEAA